jgi:hypothetical protein
MNRHRAPGIAVGLIASALAFMPVMTQASADRASGRAQSGSRRPPSAERPAPAAPAPSEPSSSGQTAVPRSSAGGETNSGPRTTGSETARPARRRAPEASPPPEPPHDAAASVEQADRSTVARRSPVKGEYTSTAVPRAPRPPLPVPGIHPWSHTRYYPSSWYWLPSAWGLGYWAYYDPWNWGWGAPTYSYGYGSGAGFETGSIRFKISPKQSQVFVDGYYAGVVDDFDGVFQKLELESGPHDIEVRLDGHAPLQFKVYVTHDRTTTLRGELK